MDRRRKNASKKTDNNHRTNSDTPVSDPIDLGPIGDPSADAANAVENNHGEGAIAAVLENPPDILMNLAQKWQDMGKEMAETKSKITTLESDIKDLMDWKQGLQCAGCGNGIQDEKQILSPKCVKNKYVMFIFNS